jgi:hypothetical protein
MKQSVKICFYLRFLLLISIFLLHLFPAFAIKHPGNAMSSKRNDAGIRGARKYLSEASLESSPTLNPSLVFSSYLGGGSVDKVTSVAIGQDGYVYITGLTQSGDFPVSSGTVNPSTGNIFVAKFDIANKRFLYSRILQGIIESAIAVDNSGNAYITGVTDSRGFQVTQGAFQTEFLGRYSAYVVKLDTTGNIVYSTFLGGGETSDPYQQNGATTYGRAIAVDTAGNAYITGITSCLDFPTTANALKPSLRNDFCPLPTPPPPSTPGGTPPPQSGPRQDAFVTKLNPTGTALVYSTYLGGSCGDSGNGIAVDFEGNVYVVGETTTNKFPVVNAIYNTLKGRTDGFVAKLNATGSALLYSTYFGGKNADSANAIAVDRLGNAYITGTTSSTDLQVTSKAFQTLQGSRIALKSTNGGETWASLNRGLDDYASGLYFSPSNPDILYANDSLGLSKSLNAGESWDKISNKQAIAIDPQNPGILYSIENLSGGIQQPDRLLKSIDEGKTWNYLNFSETHIFDLSIDQQNSNLLYVETQKGVFHSTDGGATWSEFGGQLAAQPQSILAIDPKNSSTIFVQSQGIYRTNNGGKKWKPVNLDRYIDHITIDPVTSSTIYASGASIFKSTDGGETWVDMEPNIFSNFIGKVVIDPFHPSILYTSTRLNGRQVAFKSPDGGKTWKEILSEPIAADEYQISISPQIPSTLYITYQFIQTDAFAAKLSSSGSEIMYCTYLGGQAEDRGTSIAVDSAGNAFVSGLTGSIDFLSRKAFQPDFRLMRAEPDPLTPLTVDVFNTRADVFVTKLTPDGESWYSTFLGGNSSESSPALALDQFNNLYIAGGTASSNFPGVSPLQFYRGLGDAFLARIVETAPTHPAPVISGITPNTGATTGKTPITIKGENFVAGATVSLGGIPAEQVQVINSTTIQAVTGERFAETIKAFVTNPDGQSGLLNQAFTYLLTPKVLQVDAVDKRLQVAAQNLDKGAIILIDGKEIATQPDIYNTYFLLKSKKPLRKILPSSSVQVQVRNANGMISPPFPFIRQP